MKTQHFVFHLSEDDHVDAIWQEAYHEWLLDQLGVRLADRIDYYKYRDTAQKHRLTGTVGNGIAYPQRRQVHTIFPTDNHETVHVVVVLTMGRPPAVFNEGVAVAFEADSVDGDTVPRWGTASLDDIARDYWRRGLVPSLDDLLPSRSFFSHPEIVVYPLSGSFVHYLLSTRGVPAFHRFLASSGFEDDPAVTRTKFKTAYGVEMDSVWNAWRVELLAGP